MHDDDISREANGKHARGPERAAGISREANGKHTRGSTVPACPGCGGRWYPRWGGYKHKNFLCPVLANNRAARERKRN